MFRKPDGLSLGLQFNLANRDCQSDRDIQYQPSMAVGSASQFDGPQQCFSFPKLGVAQSHQLIDLPSF
jgi:hypothetical protein